jgi:hypothetical protein
MFRLIGLLAGAHDQGLKDGIRHRVRVRRELPLLCLARMTTAAGLL